MSPPSHSQHLATLLPALVEYLLQYVVMTPAQADTAALWSRIRTLSMPSRPRPSSTWGVPRSSAASRAARRARACRRTPWRTIMPSEAVLFRKIDAVADASARRGGRDLQQVERHDRAAPRASQRWQPTRDVGTSWSGRASSSSTSRSSLPRRWPGSATTCRTLFATARSRST